MPTPYALVSSLATAVDILMLTASRRDLHRKDPRSALGGNSKTVGNRSGAERQTLRMGFWNFIPCWLGGSQGFNF